MKLYLKLKWTIAMFAISSLLLSCVNSSNNHAVTLIIKTPIFNMKPPCDIATEDVYTFLKKASDDFVLNYKKAKVNIEISQYSNEHRLQEVPLSYGTKNAPDIVFCDTTANIYTGHVVSLNDILSDAIKADIDSKYFKLKSIQNKLYTMPFFTTQMVLCYNKNLFRQAGLEQFISDKDYVQSWTVKEWEIVLNTLRQNLPDTIYPMMMYAGDEQGDSLIMLLLRSNGDKFFDSNNNFNLEASECLTSMQFLYDGVTKGYFPPRAENLEMLDCYELFIAGQLGIYCVNSAIQPLYDKANIDCGYVNFPSVDKGGLCTSTIQGFQVFDNNDKEKLQVAKDFIKYIYETKWLDYSATSIPVSNRVQEQYATSLKPLQKYINNKAYIVNIERGNPAWDEVRKCFFPNIQELLSGSKSVQEIAKQIDTQCNFAIQKGRESQVLHD